MVSARGGPNFIAVLLLGLTQVGAVTNCRHGTFDNNTNACHCDDGWATAGITDTLDFLEGVCEQYHCKSDKLCQEVLGIPSAQCPVPNWNCYCGFWYSFMNNFHGFEVPKEQKGGAECMGLMYAFSVFSTELVGGIMASVWRLILGLAVVALPFGRKRAMCDHHVRSLWRAVRRVCGRPSACDGQCVLPDSYNSDCFLDDIAWTLYVLDLGVWLYLFLACAYVILFLVWSFVLWLLVVLTMIVFMLAAMCMVCAEGGAGGCDCAGGCHCGGDCGCGDLCGCMPMDGGGAAGGADASMYYGGVFPADTSCGYGCWNTGGMSSGSGQGCCCDCCCPESSSCRCLISPLAWLCLVFPRPPENAWGGLMGFCFGTHRYTPEGRLYEGDSCFIEMLAFRRQGDNHDNREWRLEVFNFLQGPDPPAIQRGRRDQDEQPLIERNDDGSRVVRVGRATATEIDRPFEEHQCVPSSFEDYQSHTCWVCCKDDVQSWDLWVSCRHLYCTGCSEKMLTRRMPCPLCRVASTHVLRGTRYPDHSH